MTSAGGSPEQGGTTCTSHLGPSARHMEVSGHPGAASGCPSYRAAQVALVVKNPPANAGDAKDAGTIPELGRSPGGGHGHPLQYLAWEIPWSEVPGGLQLLGSLGVGHD